MYTKETMDDLTVSIHAPVWGATRSGSGNIYKGTSFNPRSRMGSDPLLEKVAKEFRRFQSTLPHGERHDVEDDYSELAGVSIHAPARGATGD